MQATKLTAVVVLAVLVVAIACVAAAPAQDDVEQGVSLKDKLRNLFNFKTYKMLFHKVYSGILEELSRARYFLARAARVVAAAIGYRFRQQPYYLSINHMSDYSPKEVEKMSNRMLDEAKPVDEELESDERALLEEPEEVVEELEELAEAQVGERSAGHWMNAGLRDLPVNRLVNTGADVQLDAESQAKVVTLIGSTEPKDEPLDHYLNKPVQEVAFIKLGWPESEQKSSGLLEHDNRPQNLSQLNKVEPEESGNSVSDKKPDEVFIDLRDNKCFLPVRDQGICGSCYAFATISLMEWYYCNKTGNLTAFSEQYMVDCGKQYVEDMYGCRGAAEEPSLLFISKFGLELLSLYPYRGNEGDCPYALKDNLKTAGYIRTEFPDAVEVHLDKFPEMLKYGPINSAISQGPGFLEYGGGVHGYGCNQTTTSHAIVIIGHGREDGKEYWLIRNSYSVGWGEKGHYKLAKDAGCLSLKRGFIPATKNGIDNYLKPIRNPAYNKTKIRQHNVKNVLRQNPEPMEMITFEE